MATVRFVPVRTWRLAAIALAAGAVLGIVGRVSDYLEPELVVAFALAAPWVLVAFATGTVSPRPLHGAWAGALALGMSVAVYYAVMLVAEQRATPQHALAMTALWGAGALVCGAIFGALGARARAGGVAPALLGGALAGEAALFLVIRGSAGARGHVLVAELLLGLAVVVAGARRRPLRGATVAIAMATAFAAADGAARAFMSTKGWGA